MMERVNSTTIYSIYYKIFCKCHNVPLKNKDKIEKKDMSSQWYRLITFLDASLTFVLTVFLNMVYGFTFSFKIFCTLIHGLPYVFLAKT
jgi:hypothetical protein